MSSNSGAVDVRLLDAPTSDGGRVELAIHPVDVTEPPRVGIVYIHGKGGNFYGLPFRPLVPHLAAAGTVHVSVNMRCHDLGYTRTDVPSADSVKVADVAVGGGFWEDLDIGVHDLEAAVRHARELGCQDVFLVGHSAGGFYAAAYAAADPAIAGLVLLSPLTSNKTNLGMWFPQPGELETALARAKQMVEQGRGHHLIPINAWFYGVSATTLLQRAAELDGVWSANLNAARRPTLVLWGAQESRGPMFRRLVEELQYDDKRWIELAEGEHNYIGQEEITASYIRRFVDERSRRAS